MPASTFSSLDGEKSCFSASFQTVTDHSCYEGGKETPMRAVCQYKECNTLESKTCIFPFQYKGKTYDTCIRSDKGRPWCSLQVDSNRNHVNGVNTVGTCDQSCAVQTCPSGFFRIDENCFHISARTYNDIVSSTDEAQSKCLNMGARLYQPRDFKSLARLLERESIFLMRSENHYLRNIAFSSFIAIGAKVGSIEPTLSIKYLDGTRAYPIEKLLEMDEKGSWQISQNTEACIMLKKDGNITIEDCNGYGLSSKKLLGYICEAKEFVTISGPQSNVSCHFPFKSTIDGPLHSTCVNDDLHESPWCATELDEKKVAISDKWGVCRDERLIAMNGTGAGKECILPFILNRVWQTKCIHNMVGELWCPTHIVDGSRVFNDPTDEVGICTDYLKPINIDCEQNYDMVDQVCLRVSPILESFDEAQNKCREEGGNLLSNLTDAFLKSLEIYISELNSSELYISQSLNFTSSTKFWIGGMFIGDDWYWKSNGKLINESLPAIECGSEECSNSFGLVFDLDAKMWDGIDISQKMPYICQSSCPAGFKWYPKIQKCLLIANTPNLKTKSAAMLDCAKRSSVLFSIDSCDDLPRFSEDIMSTMINDRTASTEFWIGYYSVDKLSYNGRRANTVRGINSKGNFGANGPCITTKEGENILDFLKSNDSDVTEYINLGTSSTSQINLHALQKNDIVEKGYICEPENDWICPNDYIMFLEDCYHYENMSTPFTSAFLHCNSMHGHLFEPKIFSQTLFLQSYLLELAITVTWTGYRRNMFKDVDGGSTYFETSTFTQTKFAEKIQASGQF